MTSKKGRSTKPRRQPFSPTNKARFIDLLEAGNYFETAAAMIGVNRSSAMDWVRRGERALAVAAYDLDEVDEVEHEYAEFAMEVRRAQATAEVRDVQSISRAAAGLREDCMKCGGQGKTDKGRCRSCQGTGRVWVIAPQWQAAAWRLERKHAKRWGLRVAQLVGEELDTFLAQLEATLDPATFARVLRATAQAQGEVEAGRDSVDETRH